MSILAEGISSNGIVWFARNIHVSPPELLISASFLLDVILVSSDEHFMWESVINMTSASFVVFKNVSECDIQVVIYTQHAHNTYLYGWRVCLYTSQI